MISNEGFIKINRSILDWEWYQDMNVTSVFIHCLLKANYKDVKWQGIEVKRGSFISSYQHLADETGLSVQNVRTAIKKLILTNNLTKSSTSKYTVFTVVNYSLYQDNQQANRHTNQQATNKQLTTSKERKERKEVVVLCPTTDKLLSLCKKMELNNVNVNKFYETYCGKKIQVEKMLRYWNETEYEPMNSMPKVKEKKYEFKSKFNTTN